MNHVHLKVHLLQSSGRQRISAKRVAHTGRVFFPEHIARAISAQLPYADHHIERTTLAQDHVFNEQPGQSAIARMQGTVHAGAETFVATPSVSVTTGGIHS